MAVAHDKLAMRLGLILTKLNNGEKLFTKELAEEFGVTVRTVERDISERLAYLPLKKEGTGYTLEAYYLGKLTFNDIQNFAALSGIKELFPTLEESFLKNVLDSVVNSAYLIKGHNYTDTSKMGEEFTLYEQAINDRLCLEFKYKAKQRLVKPYKLLNNKGVWYLAGVEGEKLKTFFLENIVKPTLSDETYTYDSEVVNKLKTEDNIWFSDEQFEVVLKVDKSVASYFTRRNIIPNQVVIKNLEDGGIIVSTKVGHMNQILPIVRYWIPNVRVVSPESLQVELEESLKEYLI
ncbi:WYL domain-containing protein [Sulfurimonas sp. SAG-AH-194-C21]|nr:WYL domain-containing protein [Sulfurimonas sp. SAG-AH-194-C21]MDF1882616.1 WYL domain-containing protein [Sulfurimonas sp. SAG-AH-194-C21]